MNVKDSYTYREMLRTVDVVRSFNELSFDPLFFETLQASLESRGRIYCAGEGSSRYFPIGNLKHQAMTSNVLKPIYQLNGIHMRDPRYNYDDSTVILLSNSGEGAEVMNLAQKLKTERHPDIFAITANGQSSLAQLCGSDQTKVLSCGVEKGVAATMSVVEQSLMLQTNVLGHQIDGELFQKTGDVIKYILEEMPIDEGITRQLANANTIYFGDGLQNGVSNELALKFSETVKPATFIDGNMMVHGFQETMSQNAHIVLFNLPAEYSEKYHTTLVNEVGLNVTKIDTDQNQLPDIVMPAVDQRLAGVIQLAMGWRLMVEVAQANNTDLDNPRFARKIGFEYK